MGKHSGNSDEQDRVEALAASLDAQWEASLAAAEDKNTGYPALQNYESQQKDKK